MEANVAPVRVHRSRSNGGCGGDDVDDNEFSEGSARTQKSKRTSKILAAKCRKTLKIDPVRIGWVQRQMYLHTLIGLRYVFELMWYVPVLIRFCPVVCRFPTLQLPLTTNH